MLSIEKYFDVRTGLLISVIILILALYFASKKSTRSRQIFIVVTIVINLVYLIWRTVFTLPLKFGTASIVLGILLILAEWMGFWQFLVFRILFWKPYKSSEWPDKDFIADPTVDIFISTYNEDMKILKKTISGCLSLDYPKDRLNIYLCDDGKRKEIENLCEVMGINYLTRDGNKDAKAGNVNNALNHTNGEFVVLLDADMVPKSSFLRKTIGYFVDEKMGFVQTPQVFYNPDPFQYNLKMFKKIPNEQDFFMLEIQGGRDFYNAVLHVGTNAVFRRKAIEDIGGVPTGTITEDMATGMLIQAKGYKTKFVKEVLCTGLSVESFSDLVKQRERWCRGNIQVIKKWNPLTLKGLSPMQRLIYIDGFFYWFFGIQKMIYILCPLIYLLFSTVILNASVYDLLLFWLPSFLASTLTYRALVRSSRTVTWSHIYEVATAPFLSLAALVEAIFSRPIPFKVTPKGINTERTSISLRYAIPHIIIITATIAGWILTGIHLNSVAVSSVNSTAINLFWSAYNAIAIATSIFVCIERPRKRSAERMVADENVSLSVDEGAMCRIVDLSESGAKVECGSMANQTGDLSGPVKIKSRDFENLEGKIIWTESKGDRNSFGIKFNELPIDVYKKIVSYISNRSKGYHEDK